MTDDHLAKREGGRRLSERSRCTPPFFSIITVVYNGESFLENTIISIIDQWHKSFEYIIVDGGSTDATLDIIKRYDSKIDYWLSEPDNGISDAFNKGFLCSRGQYINFQGDGDGFAGLDVLSRIENISSAEMLISGRINRIDCSGNVLFESPLLSENYKPAMLTRMPFPHQGLFLSRAYFDKYGLFDTSLRFSMDYELLLRSYSSPESVKTTDLIVANWRDGGVGTGKEHDLFEEYKRIRIKWISLPRWLVVLISDVASWKFFCTQKMKTSSYKD